MFIADAPAWGRQGNKHTKCEQCARRQQCHQPASNALTIKCQDTEQSVKASEGPDPVWQNLWEARESYSRTEADRHVLCAWEQPEWVSGPQSSMQRKKRWSAAHVRSLRRRNIFNVARQQQREHFKGWLRVMNTSSYLFRFTQPLRTMTGVIIEKSYVHIGQSGQTYLLNVTR